MRHQKHKVFIKPSMTCGLGNLSHILKIKLKELWQINDVSGRFSTMSWFSKVLQRLGPSCHGCQISFLFQEFLTSCVCMSTRNQAETIQTKWQTNHTEGQRKGEDNGPRLHWNTCKHNKTPRPTSPRTAQLLSNIGPGTYSRNLDWLKDHKLEYHKLTVVTGGISFCIWAGLGYVCQRRVCSHPQDRKTNLTSV